MALKQWHKTGEMATNDTKMDSESDKYKHKYNSKIPTGKWLPPQYVKWRVLKFRLATFVAPLKWPRFWGSGWLKHCPVALSTQLIFLICLTNAFEHGVDREAISGNFAVSARNCLTSMFKCIGMQMRKVNCEKGYLHKFVNYFECIMPP